MPEKDAQETWVYCPQCHYKLFKANSPALDIEIACRHCRSIVRIFGDETGKICTELKGKKPQTNWMPRETK